MTDFPANTYLWAGSHVPASIRAFNLMTIASPAGLPADAEHLVVVGGGSRIDEAKALRIERPELKLTVLPTLWGSGAEASPVVVLNRPEGKEIHVDDALIPDGVILDDEVLATISEQQVLNACADTWAHALEGCFSPLASEELQKELATLIQELLEQEVRPDMAWFDLSARACAGQAQSGVGLAHGIAHVLEPALNDPAWGHARLIRAVLLPVLRFNRSQGDKWACTAKGLGLDLDAVEQALASSWNADDFAALADSIRENWMTIARDPLSRLNSVLVRRNSVDDLL